MAVSLSRIAAFEFLIRFRSTGSAQLKNATRGLTGLAQSAKIAQRQMRASSSATNKYATSLASLKGLSKDARKKIRESSVDPNLSDALNSGAKARVDASRRKNFRGALGSRRNLASALASGPVQALRKSFGDKTAGKAAILLAGLKTGLTRLMPVVSAVTGVVKVFFVSIKIGLNLFAKWLKFNALLIAGVGLLGAGLAKLADNFTNLANRLRVTSDGTQSVQDTMNEILDIAIRSRTPFSDLAELYGRIAINAKQFGVSTRDIARVTEITGKAFRIGGSNAREASQAAIQFSQALGSNRLSGDELRAVREQAPELSQTLAKGLTALGTFGKVGVGDLKKFGEEGTLTTKVVVEALRTQEKEVNRRFARLERTFSDGVTNIRSVLFFLSSSILTSLNLGPKLNIFTDKIVESFRKIASRSGEVGAALKNLPELFKALNLNGLEKLSNFLKGVGEFFENLPDKILESAKRINNFVNAVRNGSTADEAARNAFNVGSGSLRSRFEPINNLVGSAVGQLELFISTMSSLVSVLSSLVRILDNIPFIGTNSVAQPSTSLYSGSTTRVGTNSGITLG